ncbi:MAG: hypothetical protein NXH75_06610, partial [Halobacteriovoraceae bacterium]|nr:hypothetical protein [Halobacteriovoraceae bacterium]
MTHLKSIGTKILEDLGSSERCAKISGVDFPLYFFLLRENQNILQHNDHEHQLLIFLSQEKAEEAYEIARKHFQNYELLYFPGFDHTPYGGHVASERILFERFFTLNKICNFQKEKESKGTFVFTTLEALHSKLPPRKLIEDSHHCVEVSDIISPDQLKAKLVDMGYQNSTTVEEPGTFSNKGEIFDIYPVNRGPLRLHYFDDMVEEIFEIQKETLKTDRSKSHEKVEIGPSPRLFCNSEFATNLRGAIPMPPASHKEKFEYRKEVLAKLSDGFMFEGYPSFVPLFTETNDTLFDYLGEKFRLHLFDEFHCLEDWERFYDDMEEEYQYSQGDANNLQILPGPERLFFRDLLGDLNNEKISIVDFNVSYEMEDRNTPIELNHMPLRQFLDLEISANFDKKEFFNSFFEKIKKVFQHSGKISFFHSTEASKDEFKHLCEIYEVEKSLLDRISFDSFPLKQGFYYESEKTLFLTEGDLFSSKRRKVKEVSQKDLDLFAEQIATLSKGDYVIHSDHGIGKYLGLESLDLKEDQADFLVI